MTLLRLSMAIAGKDLAIELRGHRAMAAAAPFVATVLLSFGLALGPGRALLEQSAPGLLWLSILFASVLAFRESYRFETEDAAIDELVLAPIDKASIFLGKAAAVAIELLVLEGIVVALSSALFGLSLAKDPPVLIAALSLGTIGLASVGSLFGVLAESPRAGEGLLPILLLPLATPVLLAGVRATAAAAGAPGTETGAAPWLGLLSAFDVAFVAIGTLSFEHVLEEW